MVIEKNKHQVWEDPKGSGIKIRERINPNNSISYCISVPTRLSGKRKIEIKQFKNKDHAKGWAEKQFTLYQNYGKKAQDLNARARIQAIEAFEHIKNKNITLDAVAKNYISMMDQLSPLGITPEDAISFAVERLKPLGGDKTFQEVTDGSLSIFPIGTTVRSFLSR